MKQKIPLIIAGTVVLILLLIGVYLQMQQAKIQKEKILQERVVVSTPTPSPIPKETLIGALESSITLTITAPLDKTTVKTNSILVKGKTTSKAEIFVNDKETIADANGNFSVLLPLEEGDNQVLVVANDADGNVTEKELTVGYVIEE